MEPKTIIAIVLMVFTLGSLGFLYVRNRRK